jgi:hypothetical protein
MDCSEKKTARKITTQIIIARRKIIISFNACFHDFCWRLLFITAAIAFGDHNNKNMPATSADVLLGQRGVRKDTACWFYTSKEKRKTQFLPVLLVLIRQ